MKRFILAFLICSCLPVSLWSQSLSLNDSSIVQSKVNRIGINLGSINYWDNGQVLKNLVGTINPNFEPLTDRQIWSLASAGTTTTFTVPDIWDGVPANYWAGGTFTVVASQSGANLGCTGTIASNTGPNYPVAGVTNWVAPTVTVTAPCSAAFAPGDEIVLTKSFFPTPESWWENGNVAGIWAGVANGGRLISDTSDLCATCGTQALTMDATANDSSATAEWYFDTSHPINLFVLMNGTYEISFWAKGVSGNPRLTVSASRLSAGGFNCGTYTPELITSWQKYTLTCSASESAATTALGPVKLSFLATGGSVYLDNVSFQKVSSGNNTAFRDEVIQALQSYYGSSDNGPSGVLRYWVNQNGETLDNWTRPDYERAPTSSGTGYFVGPAGAGNAVLSLHDFLVICKALNVEPYLEVPVTFTNAEGAGLIEFLAGAASTNYGAKRAALGQSDPWTSVFSKIHLSFCNECWNGSSFVGQSLADRTSQPNSEYYYDYSVRARDIFAAMRASSSYSASAFDLVMNAQTAVSYTMDTAVKRAHPDSIEVEDYVYPAVNDYSSDAALWQPAMVEPYMKVTYANDPKNFYQSVKTYQKLSTCGASGSATCKVNIYEWGEGTLNGSIDQVHMDYINAGAGQGVILALQPLLNMQYFGIMPQSLFSLTEFQNGALNGHTAKLWGSVVDMGGATNNARPAFLAISLVNKSIIGPMYSCSIANGPTYNFSGTKKNGYTESGVGMPALSNIPYIYSFCFQNGAQRSIVLINTDLANSHTISFSGTNPPTGAVTQRQYAPSSLNSMNEAGTGTASNTVQATVALASSTLSSPSSVTLPPYSVTALDYSISGSALPIVATPTFSPAGGTYGTTQNVSLTTSTSGATIYYTTDGSTPTTASAVYANPIAVTSSETIQAIAAESGYTTSAVGSAVYVISQSTPAAKNYTLSGTNVTLTSGSNGTSTLTIVPAGGYTGSITFACVVSSRPASASSAYDPACTSTTAAITDSSKSYSVALKISAPASTTAHSKIPLGPLGRPLRGFVILASLLLVRIPLRRRSTTFGLCTLVLLTVMASLSGCGFHPGQQASTSTGSTKTHSGTYVLTVTGADSQNNLNATTTISVVVQ